MAAQRSHGNQHLLPTTAGNLAASSDSTRRPPTGRRHARRLVHEPLESRQLLAVDAFAPIDGIGNNEANPDLGSSNQQFIRIAPAAFADGLSEPARLDQMNAREISNLLSAQEGSIPNDRFITSMWFQWGQFLDHDIARVFDVAPFEQLNPETESLDISDEFPFNRSDYDPATGATNPRQFVNHVTAFIDGSVVYGSDAEHALGLRTLFAGKLRSQQTDVGELLPFNTPIDPNDPTSSLINAPPFAEDFFVAGDVRANENIGLTSMQTLWVREHNRIADELLATEFADQDPTDPEVDEEIYQRARQIVVGLIQNITYNEFLPSTLGFNAIPTYSGYDSSIDPQLSNTFATAAYRVGHTALSDEMLIGGDGESIGLRDAFFQPQIVSDIGIDGILDGLTLQKMEEVDALIVDAVRNFLDDGPGFDLAAINIQRGRDHGLPDFNTVRAAIGLDPIDDFSQLTSDQSLAAMFEQIYGAPDNADPWIAMIAEDHVPGTMTGETIYAYMVDQFTRLRDGDRFYFQNALDEDLAAEIKATRLSDVIERNTDLDVQDEVFWTRDTLVFRNGLDNEWLIRDFGENGGAEVVFFGEPGIRDPDNREETSPVQRDEPINAVIVAGTNEMGDGFFIPNALVAAPLADQGIDEFIITAEIEFFEGYGLGGRDRWVFESNIDSIFASGDEGQDELSAISTLAGAEIAFTGGDDRDRLYVHATEAASVDVSGDDGRDSIRVTAPGSESIVVAGGDGRDRLRVRAPAAISLLVSAGSGGDQVYVFADDAELVELSGDAGNDNLYLEARDAALVQVTGDAGWDRIRVRAIDAEVVAVLGGEGRDRLSVRVGADTDLELDGGPGRDRVFDNGHHFRRKSRSA